VRRTLVQLAASLGGAVEDVMDEAIRELMAVDLLPLDASGEQGAEARLLLAQALLGLDAAAARLCDRLGMRHFSHTGLDVHTVAA